MGSVGGPCRGTARPTTFTKEPLGHSHVPPRRSATVHYAYQPGQDREDRQESERFTCFTYDELLARDKVNLDITWLRDPDLEDGDNPQPPEVIAQEIVDDLQAALDEFAAVAEALQLAKAEHAGHVADT
jgi:hypothetical protein